MMKKRRLFVIGITSKCGQKIEANREELIALLQRIPGIHHFLEVEEKSVYRFTSYL